jgi:hypothetical protein
MQSRRSLPLRGIAANHTETMPKRSYGSYLSGQREHKQPMNIKCIASLLMLTSLGGCATAQPKEKADFNKIGKSMTITVTSYDHMPDLLTAYNKTRAPSHQYPYGETIDGFAEFSESGMVCNIYVYRHPMSNTYNNYIGHEMRHCLEGNWHS